MKLPRFTLWSALVFLTACQLLLSAASGSLVVFFLYVLVIIASVKVVRYKTLHPLIRFILLSAITTPPLLLMLAVFMPPGFAGVPYMVFVMVVFVGLFVMVAVVEKSLIINLCVLLFFWMSISIGTVLNPGTAANRWGQVVEILLQISLIGVVHGAIQLGVAWGFRKLSRKKVDEEGRKRDEKGDGSL